MAVAVFEQKRACMALKNCNTLHVPSLLACHFKNLATPLHHKHVYVVCMLCYNQIYSLTLQ